MEIEYINLREPLEIQSMRQGLLHQGLTEPELYRDLVYKFKGIIGLTDFFLISFEK